MTTAEKERPPARRGSLAAKKATGGVAAFRTKDEAVLAARQLGHEVVRIQVKRFTGNVRKIVEFDMPAIDAADLIERSKMLSTSVTVNLEAPSRRRRNCSMPSKPETKTEGKKTKPAAAKRASPERVAICEGFQERLRAI